MALVIITGHVLATSPPMGRAHPRDRRLAANAARRGRAGRPSSRSPASWFNWGFSLVFSAVLRDRDRAAGGRRRLSRAGRRQHARARQHLGAGPQRIGRAADGHARRAAAADPRHRVARRHGARRHDPVPPHDLLCGRASRRSLVEMVVVVAVMWLATPPAGEARPRADLGIDLGDRSERRDVESLEPRTSTSRSHGWSTPRSSSWLVVALGVRAISRATSRRPASR